MKKLALVFIFLFVLSGCSLFGNNQNGTSSGAVANGTEKKVGQTIGSCNAIKNSATCLEYSGSYWTEEQITSNCQGSFSKEACPKGAFGGCQTGLGTSLEMTSWMYKENGSGTMATEVMENAQKSCESLEGAQWVTPL